MEANRSILGGGMSAEARDDVLESSKGECVIINVSEAGEQD